MTSLMWTNTYIPLGVMQNMICVVVVVGNSDALCQTVCTFTTAGRRTLAYNWHETEFFNCGRVLSKKSLILFSAQ